MIERYPFFAWRICCKEQSFDSGAQGFMVLDALAAVALLMIFAVLISKYHVQHSMSQGITQKQSQLLSRLITECEKIIQGDVSMRQQEICWQPTNIPVKVQSALFSPRKDIPFVWVKANIAWPETQGQLERIIIAGYVKKEGLG